MWKKLTFLCVCWLVTAVSRSATLTVDLKGGADYTEIQSAIDAAVHGDTVLVKPGEYVIEEPISFKGKKIAVKGEAGAEATAIRMSEIPEDPSRSSVVIFETRETEESALEGFTITGGKGTKYGTESWQVGGGGIFCTENSSPTLTNCTISGNWCEQGGGVYCGKGATPILTNCAISGNATWEGGGVYCGENSSPTLTNCRISGNSAGSEGAGGGVYCEESYPILTNCTISGNWALVGGGVYCDGGSPILTNCTISQNSAACLGGGLLCGGGSPTLTKCTISGNSAVGSGFLCKGGGGVFCRGGGSPTLTECTISGNSAYWYGGGVFCEGDSSPTLANCTISGNWALAGGGMYCDGGSPILTNCTISGNSARYGGGLDCYRSTPTLTNCIVWDNLGGSVTKDDESHPPITYSCIEGDSVWDGEGNINVDPLFCGWDGPSHVFVDGSNGTPGNGTEGNPFRELSPALRYRLSLQRKSPCLGTGMNAADMGADAGLCDEAGPEERVVHMGPGSYGLEGLSLVQGASILGAGEKETVLQGTIWGLRTGAVLSKLTVTGGTYGGVVVREGENPVIEDCTISGNSGRFAGGGVYCEGGSPILTSCTISGNSADGGGGVFCCGGSPTLTNCTISGNWAERSGGGVCCCRGSPTLTNCTISGNSAYWEGGGGVNCSWNSFPTLTNCTISGNSASWEGGGGVYCELGSSPTLTNCIVWGNTPESVCGSLSHCLTDQDPLFVKDGAFNFHRWKIVMIGSFEDQLPDFIVEEPDHHLQPGSPAIDAGKSLGAPTTDIEGHGRPCRAGVDIGAYEFGDCPPSGTRFVRGDANADGATDLSDAVAILSYLFLGINKVPCEQAGDANDDGALDISDGIHVLSFLFLGGKAIEPPVEECGIDPTGHDLPCETFPGCE